MNLVHLSAISNVLAEASTSLENAALNFFEALVARSLKRTCWHPDWRLVPQLLQHADGLPPATEEVRFTELRDNVLNDWRGERFRLIELGNRCGINVANNIRI